MKAIHFIVREITIAVFRIVNKVIDHLDIKRRFRTLGISAFAKTQRGTFIKAVVGNYGIGSGNVPEGG
jgi:hypothetical protein